MMHHPLILAYFGPYQERKYFTNTHLFKKNIKVYRAYSHNFNRSTENLLGAINPAY